MGEENPEEAPEEDDSEERGRKAAIDGFAHEQIVCGLLMKRYGNVSRVTLPLSSYDIIMVHKLPNGSEDVIRIQSKTASHSIHFTGGTRGGRDRTYKSGVKTYVQNPELSDCVVGIHFEGNEPVMYFVPTLLIAEWGTKSISINKIEPLKNNFEMLERCKDRDFVLDRARSYGII